MSRTCTTISTTSTTSAPAPATTDRTPQGLAAILMGSLLQESLDTGQVAAQAAALDADPAVVEAICRAVTGHVHLLYTLAFHCLPPDFQAEVVAVPVPATPVAQ